MRVLDVGPGAGTVCALLFVLGAVGAGEQAWARDPRLADWTTLQSERHGFAIAYPGNVFALDGRGAREDGYVLVSHDGSARLLVATFQNEAGTTLMEYRDQLLSENYAGADIEYAPVRKRWFVVSGTRDGMHFYERVSFTCSGQLINSWALLYPAAQRRFYDRVVEAISRTYEPGAGPSGDCD